MWYDGGMSIKEHPPLHVPVLLDDVVRLLNPKEGESYLDLTAGYGGHASAIVERTQNYREMTLVDRDDFARANLAAFVGRGAEFIHADFVSAARQLIAVGKRFDMILIDLGVSSPQLDRAERGFSFSHNGPLDMRMDQRQALTAADVANTFTQQQLEQIICEYGEERPVVARRYAAAIVKARPLATTEDLASAVLKAHVGRRQRTHPATRTFQAIRIFVNDELEQVRTIMPLLPELLRQGGRVGVISFHSLEDRIVKRYFAEQNRSGYEAELRVVTKHPVDGAVEDVHNPRSRSAKLRVAVKT
jgi:S-adenosyl-methyltransferase mraW